ncbi:MAG: hypothetical protein ACI3X6_04310, partial [Alloprevotella sp.]
LRFLFFGHVKSACFGWLRGIAPGTAYSAIYTIGIFASRKNATRFERVSTKRSQPKYNIDAYIPPALNPRKHSSRFLLTFPAYRPHFRQDKYPCLRRQFSFHI